MRDALIINSLSNLQSTEHIIIMKLYCLAAASLMLLGAAVAEEVSYIFCAYDVSFFLLWPLPTRFNTSGPTTPVEVLVVMLLQLLQLLLQSESAADQSP